MEHPLIGRRVRLLYCADEYTKLKRGTEGTVVNVDSANTIHVAWDDGSRLGMVAEAGDVFEVLS